MQCFCACSRQYVLKDETAINDKGETQVPFDSARSSPVAAADNKLSSLMQSGLTQQPEAAFSCEQHNVPDDVNIEPSPTGSLDSFASASGLSLARKPKAGSAGVDSSSASAGSAAACSTTRLHSAMANMAPISSAASARHLQCKLAQQSVLFAPAVLPNRSAFSRSDRAAHLEQFATAPQALTASKNSDADRVFPLRGGHQEAEMLMPKEDRLVNDVPSRAGGMQAAPTQYSSDQLSNQGLNGMSGYDLGRVNEANSSWESPQQSKNFLGRRKCDFRKSLDMDFNMNENVAVTRRSKDYGEHTRKGDSGGSAK
ncbi:TPA: hypothetical protein ACH3X1_006795 [Trebouxia sp. C0004]